MKQKLQKLDTSIIGLSQHSFLWAARIALFIVFFWFGFLKFFGVSPAEPLAREMVGLTIGLEYFGILFALLATIECVIGILFLIPKATRIVIPLLFLHMAIVVAPLALLPGTAWQSWFVPTLEGQYIIKNLVVIVVAIGIASRTEPLIKK